MRIYKIGSPIRRGNYLWWPVFERFADGSPDSPPVAYCRGPLRARKGHFSSLEAHKTIDRLRGTDLVKQAGLA